jgi:hypothetical protein
MFNPLPAPVLVTILGGLLRASAERGGPGSDYDRAQLLAGYSMGKYLAAELEGGPEVLRWFRGELVRKLGDAGLAEGADAVRTAEGPAALGEALTDVLRRPVAAELRSELHGLLRRLADREIDVLAGA